MNYLSILHMVLPFVILVGAKPTDADLHKLRGRDLRDRNLEGADLRDGFELHPLGAD